MRWPSVFVVFAALAACGDGTAGGLPLDQASARSDTASRWVVH